MCQRALAFALVLLLLLLTACSTAPAADAPANNDIAASAPANNDTPAGNDTPADNEASVTGNAPAGDDPYGGLVLPLSDGSTTFRVYRATSGSITRFEWNDFAQVPGFARAEELTGVKIQWEVASDFISQFPLMIASGDWADCAASYINGGTLTTYVGDEVIQDLTDYIPDNAPLYQIRRTGDAAITRDTMTDEGQLVAFYNIKQTVQGSWAGPWARADWLAEYGAEGSDLVTYDDWLNFLVWAKDAHSDTLLTPYGFNAQGLDRYLLTGYGLSNDWIVENGEVKHSVLQPAFKDYLNMCIDWYSKGAISDFVFSGDRLTFDNYAEGACAMAMTYTNWWDTIYNYAAQKDNNEGFDIVAIGIPKLNPDDIRRIEHGTCPTTRNEALASYIFTSCDDIPLLCQWFDFLYTDEASRICDFGIEGESYTINEDGHPEFTDKILESPEGYGYMTAMREYIADGLPHFYDWTREMTKKMAQGAVDSIKIWNGNWQDEITDELTYPSFATRTTKEGETYSSIMNDIDTMIQETVPKFIRGDMAMSEWDSFLASIEQMNIGEARDIQQAAYDRYMSR